MRISIMAGIIAFMPAGAVQAASDGDWCYRDFSGPQFTNCMFFSARQCLEFARIGGGVCERNRAPAVSPPPKSGKKARRS